MFRTISIGNNAPSTKNQSRSLTPRLYLDGLIELVTRSLLHLVTGLCAFGAVSMISVQAAAATHSLDWAAPPGPNYDRAEFRLWYPDTKNPLRGVIVLTPGSNEDGRTLVGEARWQTFAAQHDLALVGCRFTDQHPQDISAETYANASGGSGQALLDGLDAFAKTSTIQEFAHIPLLLWGMSAGGEFNYEFVGWRPNRVAGFIVNKGGIYYSALLPSEARNVPGLLFIGGQDLETRNDAIRGLFAINRRAGAFWALVEEPNAGHVVGKSRDIAEIFFEDLIGLRFPKSVSDSTGLRSITESDGFLGDPKSQAVRRVGPEGSSALDHATSWLSSHRMAQVWKEFTKRRTKAAAR